MPSSVAILVCRATRRRWSRGESNWIAFTGQSLVSGPLPESRVWNLDGVEVRRRLLAADRSAAAVFRRALLPPNAAGFLRRGYFVLFVFRLFHGIYPRFMSLIIVV